MMIPLCRVTVTTTLLLLLLTITAGVVSAFPNNLSPYSSSSLPTTTISTTIARRLKGAAPATTIAPTCTALFILQQEEEENYSPTIFNNLFSMFDDKNNNDNNTNNNSNSKNKKTTFMDATLVELVERLEEADVGQDLLEEVTMMQDQQQIVELPVMFTGGGEYYEDDNTNTATTASVVSFGMGDLGDFDFERWTIHRSPNRYNRLLVGIFTGITSRRIFPTVLVIVAWTTWVGVYASVETQYGLPEIELPLTPFELASSVLGLLLVFRSNTAFERFNVGSDATWEMTGRFRSIIRQLLSFTSVPNRFSAEERAAAYDLIDACLVLHGWILCDYLQQRSSRKFKGQPSQRQRKQSRSKQAKILQKALALPYDVTKQLLTTSSSSSSSYTGTTTTTTQNENDNDTTSIISMPVPTSIRSSQSSQQSSSSSSRTTNNNNQRRQSPSGLINTVTLGIFSRIPSLDPQESVMLEAQFTEIISSLGTCEKLLRTPIPLGYTRYSVRFLMIWLMLLPVALVRTFDTFGKNTWWEDKPQPILVIVMLFLSVAFLSIEDISVQLEEPFCVLPLQFHQKWLKKDYTQMKRTARIVDGMSTKKKIVEEIVEEKEKEKLPKRTRVRQWILQQRTKATTKVSSFFE